MRNIELFKRLLQESQSILITTHVEPDADGLGSQVSLAQALTQQGKQVFCVNEKFLAKRYQHLDPTQQIQSSEHFLTKKAEIDLLIVVDAHSTSRIGKNMQELMTHVKRLLFIDHHPCSSTLQALHCIDTQAAATGELVGEILLELGIPLTQAMALPLYTAILIDTNSFRYPTVTGRTHYIVSELMKTGLRPPQAYNDIYGTKKVQHMQLLGSILAKAQTNASGEIAWMSLAENELEKYAVNVEDTHSFINNLLVLDGVKVACMFRSMGNQVKISFRSMHGVDVGLIAQSFGGGGHHHSAAVLLNGSLDTIIEQTVQQLDNVLKQLN